MVMLPKLGEELERHGRIPEKEGEKGREA